MANFDHVTRSLRRRLWRAFQQDDAEAAMRAYQATLDEFEQLADVEDADSESKEVVNGSSPSISKARKSYKERSARISNTSRSKSRDAPLRRGLDQTPAGFSISTADMFKPTKSILQSKMKPSEPFIADDFLSPYASYEGPVKVTLPDLEKEAQKRKRRKQQRPRSAFHIFGHKKDVTNPMEPAEDDGDDAVQQDIYVTTPLHEAARLGSGDLIRAMLAHGGDPNIKNGQARTALHMCVGGVTKEEEKLMRAMNVKKDESVTDEPGIKTPVLPKEVMDFMNSQSDVAERRRRSKKGVSKLKAVSKLIMRSSKTKALRGDSPTVDSKIKMDYTRLFTLISERTDAALTLLSWSHKKAGIGVSLNAVDDLGRAALHYAAETGRTEICTAIMASFGTMLTIVDELGARTPCELASRQGHKDLAAQLEARALLYVDPYGLDDELMASVETPSLDEEDGYALAPPFNWFKTLTPRQVEEERRTRLMLGCERVRNELRKWKYGEARDRASKSRSPKSRRSKSPMNSRSKSPRANVRSRSPLRHTPSYGDKCSDDKQVLMKVTANVGQDVDMNIDGADYGGDTSKDEVELNKMDLLSAQDSHLERFLSYHRWDTYDAVDAIRKDPTNAFRKAQIQLPTSRERMEKSKYSETRHCLICIEDVHESKWMSLQNCKHGFCVECLREYIMDSAKSMTPVSNIMCPMNGCKCSISQENLDKLLANKPRTIDRISEATIRHFVSTAYDYKFCNHPGCDGIVNKVPQRFFVNSRYDPDLHDFFGAVCTACSVNRCPPGSTPVLTYDGVVDSKYNNCKSREQPVRAHRFCFGCGESMHWPVPCDKLKKWKQKIRDEIDEVDEDDGEIDANAIAQKIWIKANTKSCPRCNVLIEKNDGCNHMTCVNPNCRYEFCWICRKDWKLHGSNTGGFFRCNIWKEEDSPDGNGYKYEEADANNNEGYGTAIYSARHQHRQRQEMNRFLHHYTRYEAHDQSARLEQRMAENTSARLARVVDAAIEFDGSLAFNFGGKGLSFIHSAFTELLECRSTLKYSYAFSFLKYPTFVQYRKVSELNRIRREKVSFEKYQSELETITEQMSDILARSHLRASQMQISFLTSGAAERRVDFSNLMFSILHEERGKTVRKIEEDNYPKRGRRRSHNNQRRRSHNNQRTSQVERADHDFYDGDDDDDVYGYNRTLDFESEFSGTEMWACTACTFMNTGGRRCEICATDRPAPTNRF